MPNVGFNLDKFMRRIERQRVAEPGDVELLAELLTETLAREQRLREACGGLFSVAESAVNCVAELLYNDGSDAALKRADRSMHGFRKALAQHRAALAPEEPR